MVGLVACTFAVKELGKPSPDWPLAALALAAGAIFLWVFVRRQRRSAHPLLDLELFRHRGFRMAVVSALVASAALLGMELVFTQRLQLVLGRSPLEAGWAMLPLPLAAFVAGPVAGRLLPRWGSARLLAAALLASGLGMGGYLALHQASVLWQASSLALLGAGVGAAMTAASATLLTSAPPDRAGMAASVEEVSYELGGALGVTVMGSLLSAVYTRTLALPDASLLPLQVRDGLDEALRAAESLPSPAAHALTQAAGAAFDQGFAAVLLLATGLLLATAWAVWRRMR
jgi:DHA2 family multidrug resistance protein-like MFS transporter